MSEESRNEILEYIRDSKWFRAEQAILMELKTEPNDSWLLTNLSRCLLKIGDSERAVVYSKRALELEPENPEVKWNLAEALYMESLFEESLKYLREVFDGDHKDFMAEKGYDFAWQGRLKLLCRFKIAIAYLCLDNLAESVNWLEGYLTHTSEGVEAVYDVDYVERILGSLKELKADAEGNKPRLWVSLIEVASAQQKDSSCGFINGVVTAKSKQEAEDLYQVKLNEMGYEMISAADVEEYNRRVLKSGVHQEIRDLAEKAKKDDSAQFGTIIVTSGVQ